MKKHPLLISLALFYWGVNTGNISIAVIFMLLFESHWLVKFRWNFTTKDFNMISILSTLSAIGYLIYFTSTNQEIGLISSFLKFLPIILFPLNFFFVYSTSKYINAKKLFLLFVVNKYSIVHPYTKKFRPDYIYFACLIIGGSIEKGIYSFPALIILVFPLLFLYRSKNYKFTTWLLGLVSVVLLALMIQLGISSTFYFMKNVITNIYLDYFLNHSNKSISIGNIGSMKDDFRIELRAKIYNPNKPYYHIKEQVFNHYNNNTWQTTKNDIESFSQDYFEYGKTPVDSMRIFFFSSGKKTFMKLPFATSTVSGISVNQLKITSLGKIYINKPQSLIDYKAYTRMDTSINFFNAPNETDLKIYETDAELVKSIIDSLKLDELPFNRISFTLTNYFIKNYLYSLDYINQTYPDKLQYFISSKKGHCELFATLSCLIYRQLGYPSRYVTGYLVSEYNKFEGLHIARQKDRHAWIYVNDKKGNWYEYDTTPPDISLNRSESGFFSDIYDIFSYAYYRIFLFKSENNELFKNILLLSIIPLALFLLFRILKGVKYHRVDKKNKSVSPYEIIEELSLLQDKFKSDKIEDHETLMKWFERIRREHSNAFLTEAENEKLKIIQKLYYKKRYSLENFTKEHDNELKNNIENIT